VHEMERPTNAYPITLVLGEHAEIRSSCAAAVATMGGAVLDSAPARTLPGETQLVEALFGVDVVACGSEDETSLRAVSGLAERGEFDGALLAVSPTDAAAGSMASAVRLGADDAVSAACLSGPQGSAVLEKVLTIATRRRHRQRSMLEFRHAAETARNRAESLALRVSRLEGEAWTDPLTGLANRRQLAARLERMFAEAVRYGAELSCVMIDLDGFKQLNDMHGHREGDACLKQVAKAIADSVRASDVPARFGGDEFVVLMPRTPVCEAARVAERLRSFFHARVAPWCGADVELGISIGVASVESAKPLTGDGLIEAADRAMYASKAGGGATIMRCEANGVTSVA